MILIEFDLICVELLEIQYIFKWLQLTQITAND